MARNGKLKIIMISADFSIPPYGGIASHLYGLCSELMEIGHEVSLGIPGYGEVGIPENYEGIKLIPLGKATRPRYVRFFTRILSARRALAGIIKREKPDVIHVHDLLTGPPTAKAFSRSTAYVFTSHTSVFTAWARKPWGGFLLRRLIGRPHGVIAASPLLEERSRILRSRFLEYIPNGVDIEQFRPSPVSGDLRDALGLAADNPVVLFAGRFHPVKGLPLLFKAMQEVLPHYPNARLVVAGGGNEAEESKIKAELTSCNLRAAVIFAGKVPHENMRDYYSLASMLVLPSQMEATNIAAMEAMACGIPVVATAVGGMPEVVQDGECGFLVPPGDQTAMAGAIKNLLSDDGARGKMGEVARKRAVEHFAWRKIAERTVQFYEQVLKKLDGGESG